MMIDLYKSNPEGVLEIVGSVGFHNVPLTTIADLYCTPRGVLPFDKAERVSKQLAMNDRVGTIDEFEWRRK